MSIEGLPYGVHLKDGKLTLGIKLLLLQLQTESCPNWTNRMQRSQLLSFAKTRRITVAWLYPRILSASWISYHLLYLSVQFLHLGARELNGRARAIHGMSELVTPDSNREKKRTLLQFLSDHFQDIQTLREYLLQKQISKVNWQNRPFTKIQEKYGPYVTGALFILKQGGAVKFQDKEWIRQNDRGHFLAEFRQFQKVPVEAVDASGCAINYQGLSSLLPLKELRSLSLQRCPNLDDWCLGRLYLLAGSLQELSLAGCPRISERGLACLHHLQNLRRLDISDLPAVSHPGLTQILVEEMLPHCEVLGAGWAPSLKPGPDKQPLDTSSPLSS